jgi:hypothetical protein
MSGSRIKRTSLPTFDMGVLGRQVTHVSLVPTNGFRCCAIDTSQCSASGKGDLNALVAGLVETDHQSVSRSVLWIVGIEFGRYKAPELAPTIAHFLDKWEPQKSTIEAIGGSEFLKILVQQEFDKLDIDPKLSWTSARNLDAKAQRVARLVRLSNEGRLRLAAGAANDEFLKQATRWTGLSTNHGRIDDVLDAASALCQYVGF